MTNPTLRQELLSRFERDQVARKAAGTGDAANADLWASITAIDAENTLWMRDVVATHGWPGQSLVGSDGAQAAWLLVQHADHDVSFQKQCLALLEAAVKDGETDASCWAYLVDRVAVAEHREQVFGTQFNAEREPFPIVDFDDIDERRARVGLEPFAAYRRRMHGGG
jgi:hypothetical protein